MIPTCCWSGAAESLGTIPVYVCLCPIVPHPWGVVLMACQLVCAGEVVTALQDLLSSLEDIRMAWITWLERLEPQEPGHTTQVVECTGGPGRPRVVIREEELIGLRQLGFSWTKIATL